MKRAIRAALAAVLLAGGSAVAQEDSFDATLEGFQEVPSVSTPARGEFSARVVGEGAQTVIEYELTYDGLPTPAGAAHIHFAQRGVNGAVSAFLCGGGDKPACPPGGTVTGTIDAQDVVGPESRGIAPGEIEELVSAMRAGFTYANVHTTEYPDGELRGQLEVREDEEEAKR